MKPSLLCAAHVLSVRKNPSALPEKRVGENGASSPDTDKLLLSKTTVGGLVAERLMLQSVIIAGADAQPHRPTAARRVPKKGHTKK